LNNQLEVNTATEDAEESLLGAILIQSTGGSRQAIDAVMDIIRPWDFRGCVATDKPWMWIWRARVFYAMTLCESSPHIINVAHKLAELNLLEPYDCSLMAQCESNTPCSLDYLDYAKAVKDYSVKRQIKELSDKGDIEGIRELTEYGGTSKELNKRLKSNGRI